MRSGILVFTSLALGLSLVPTQSALGRTMAPAQTDPRLEVTVYGTTLRWFGSSVGAVFRAELFGPAGIKATAATRGSYPKVLHFSSPDSQADTRILPGDVLKLVPDDGPPLTLTVPELLVDVDAATDRIGGHGPVGSAIEITSDRDEPLGRALASADGQFRLDLAGRRDLRPPDTGTVRLTAADGVVFISWWEVTSARLWLGTRRLEVSTSLGSSVAVDIRTPDGQQRSLRHTPREASYTAGEFRLPDCPMLVAGTTVTVTKVSRIEGMDHHWSGTLPALDVGLNRQANAVTVRGEPRQTYVLSADDVNQVRRGTPVLQEEVMTDDSGRATVDLSGRATVRPGWQARIDQWPDEMVQIVRDDRLRRFRVALFGSQLEAVVMPAVPVTVTLTGEDGAAKGTAIQTSSVDGVASFSFGVDQSLAPAGPRFAPGDQIRIEVNAPDDPFVMTIPRVTMQSDVEGNRVFGACNSGFEIEIGVQDKPDRMEPPCLDGLYEARFAVPAVKLDSSGPIAFRQRSGPFEFYAGWSATSVQFGSSASTVGEVRAGSWLRASGIGGRTVRVTWLTSSGQIVGAFENLIRPSSLCCPGSRALATVLLADSAGRHLKIVPGDRFVIEVGDDVIQAVAPPLSMTIDTVGDTVQGSTLPSTELGLGAQNRSLVAKAGVYGRKTMSDASGAFRYDFTGHFDILNRDQISVSIRTPEGHTAYYYLEAPGLMVDLSSATVWGMSLPDATVSVELASGAVVSTRTLARANSDGAYQAAFRDPSGRHIVPEAGQVLTVRAHAAGGADIQTMLVPELDFGLDPQANVVRGRATPGGTLALWGRDWFFHRVYTDAPLIVGGIEARPDPAVDGTWEVGGADFRRLVDGIPVQVTLAPGVGMQAQYQLADGNLVSRTRFVPMINVEHGGPRVCGVGRPGDTVTVSVSDETGTTASQFSGVVGDDMRFDLVLADSGGHPFTTRAGHTIRAIIGAQVAELTLPPLTTSIAWDSMRAGLSQPVTRVSGVAAPFRTITMLTELQGCFTGAGPGISVGNVTAEESGGFGTWINHQTGGAGVELALYAPSHHRYFRHITRSQARVFIDTDRVSGRVTSFAPITLTLRGAGGTAQARATAVGSVESDYTVHFRNSDGRAQPIRAGDSLRLEAHDGIVDVLVESLTFDFDGTIGLMGSTGPNRDVRITLDLVDETTRRFQRRSGADGRISFGPGDVPAREAWTLTEVRRIEVVLPLEGGHEVVAESRLGDPEPDRAFLPIAVVPRHVP